MFGLATFLVADGMTFAGFFAAYLTFKAVNPLPSGCDLRAGTAHCRSSTPFCCWSAVPRSTVQGQGPASERHGPPSQLAAGHRWAGIGFLVSQMVEYFTLPFGLTDNLYASTFFAATGFHGLHVTLGALMTLIVWWQARTNGGRISPENHFPWRLLSSTGTLWTGSG